MLYIHIPYCKGKCIYCDFYSAGNPDWNKYIKAVASELSERIDELRGDSLSSIYLGGGTPSLMPAEIFRKFILGPGGIQNILLNEGIIDSHAWGNIEFTIEVNPEDVSEEMTVTWREAGINRVSMGVQTLNDQELKTIKRRHTSDKVRDAMMLLKDYFNNISLDLIYGLPNQTMDSLEKTVRGFIDLYPQHISAYALTFEKNTPIEILRNKGKIKECSEEVYLEMEGMVSSMLESAGFERYEISNYSQNGFHSRHNSGYWHGLPYVGLGPSASSYNGQNVRRTNTPDIKSYLEGEMNYETELLDPKNLFVEKIMISLRTKEGLNLNHLTEIERSNILRKASKWIETGKLAISGNNIALTRCGIPISDYIILSLI